MRASPAVGSGNHPPHARVRFGGWLAGCSLIGLLGKRCVGPSHKSRGGQDGTVDYRGASANTIINFIRVTSRFVFCSAFDCKVFI